MVNLPERTDKKDAFTLQAGLTNISFSVMDGVLGSEVSPKALPYGFNQDDGAIGCWRAHLNIYQLMIQKDIHSALIFEDDADWDVALKWQMREVARGTRFLTDHREDMQPHSPYGDGWDIIWIGHCSSGPDETDMRRWVVPNDSTVVPPSGRWEFVKPDMRPFEDGSDGSPQTRLLYVPNWGSCSAAYAISLRGAKKVLYRQSLLPFNEPVDNGMGTMCREKTFNFSCIAPFPTIIGTSTPAGKSNRGSDIRGGTDEDAWIQEKSQSYRLVFPVRQNIERLLAGETVFESQFPDVTGQNVSFANITSAWGHPEWLEHDQLRSEAEYREFYAPYDNQQRLDSLSQDAQASSFSNQPADSVDDGSLGSTPGSDRPAPPPVGLHDFDRTLEMDEEAFGKDMEWIVYPPDHRYKAPQAKPTPTTSRRP